MNKQGFILAVIGAALAYAAALLIADKIDANK